MECGPYPCALWRSTDSGGNSAGLSTSQTVCCSVTSMTMRSRCLGRLSWYCPSSRCLCLRSWRRLWSQRSSHRCLEPCAAPYQNFACRFVRKPAAGLGAVHRPPSRASRPAEGRSQRANAQQPTYSKSIRLIALVLRLRFAPVDRFSISASIAVRMKSKRYSPSASRASTRPVVPSTSVSWMRSSNCFGRPMGKVCPDAQESSTTFRASEISYQIHEIYAGRSVISSWRRAVAPVVSLFLPSWSRDRPRRHEASLATDCRLSMQEGHASPMLTLRAYATMRDQ